MLGRAVELTDWKDEAERRYYIATGEDHRLVDDQDEIDELLEDEEDEL